MTVIVAERPASASAVQQAYVYITALVTIHMAVLGLANLAEGAPAER